MPQGECVGGRRLGIDRFINEGGGTGVDSGGHATGTEYRQQSRDSLEKETGRKARRKWKCKVVTPNDKLVAGTKMLYKRNIKQDGEVKKYKRRTVASGFRQVKGMDNTEKYSPTPAAA